MGVESRGCDVVGFNVLMGIFECVRSRHGKMLVDAGRD